MGETTENIDISIPQPLYGGVRYTETDRGEREKKRRERKEKGEGKIEDEKKVN